MNRDEIRSAYHHTQWALALRGVLGIVLGIVIIARPMASVAAFALVIALWALFDGFTNIARAFALRGAVPHWWILLVGGAIGVLFGVAALYYYPGLSLTFAVVWASWWLLTAGAVAIYVAVMERRVQIAWGWTMTLGLVTLLAGLFAIVNPGATLATLLGLIAAWGIVSGILLLVAAFRLHGVKRDLSQSIGAAQHGLGPQH